MFEYRPYPKEKQIRKEKKPKKKRKNPLKPEVYKGRVIPKKQVRGRISAKEYNEALRRNGETCFFCGSPNIEMHHVMPKGYSKEKNGRGVWRNLRALCPEHHRGKQGVHQNKEMMKYLQEEHERKYGQFYWCDKYDLFKKNLIPNTEDSAYQKFMESEELKCQRIGQTLNG